VPHDPAETAHTSREGIPAFDRAKHNPLCCELKNLYTAITRARMTLMIFDEDEVLRDPMMRCWQKNGIVEVSSSPA
jgi:hypothetical protein